MGNFTKKGFLALSYQKILRSNKALKCPVSDLLVKLIESGWGIQNELEVDLEDLVIIHSVTLYARILNSIQASHLLAVYGLGAQCSNQSRAALECLFQLVALNKNKELFDGLMLSDIESTQTYLKSYLTQISDGRKISPKKIEAVKKKIEVLESRIKDLKKIGVKKLGKVEAISKEAGMHSWYELIYRVLCRGTHSSLISLQEHLQINGDSQISHFTNEPNYEDFFSNTYCNLKILTRAIEEVYKSVKEPPPPSLADYNKQLEELGFDQFIFQQP